MTGGRIYLFNNTVHTKFDEVLERIPREEIVFVNRRIEQRYREALAGRAYRIVDSGRLVSFRPLLAALLKHQKTFVCLDVDQAGFQTVAYIAWKHKSELIPIVPPRGMKAGQTIFIEHPLDVLPKIQKYLLDSYMSTPNTRPIHLFNELLSSAKYYGEDRVICKDISGKATYKQILLNAYVLSKRLRRVLRGVQNIALFLPNSIGLEVTLFSLFYLDKTPVLLNYSAGEQTILDACETADIPCVLTSRVFIQKGQLEVVEAALKGKYRLVYMEDLRNSISLADKLTGWLDFKRRRRAKGTENKLVLFTSGSEYRPRGIVLSHDNIFANVQQTRSVIDFGIEDRMLNSMPMFHSFGLTAGAILPLLSGIQTYLYPSPLHYKRIPELAREEQSTILFGTSSFLEKYGQFADADDFQTVRYAVAGAERLKSEVEAYWINKFHLQIMQGYGATETSPLVCLDTPINHKQDSVGRFVPGMDHQLRPVEGIREGGQLLVRGPNVMVGYLQHGSGYTAQDEWYDTGDIVTVDEQGFVTIVGRLKRFAKIAGEMVSLGLVEQLAQTCFGSTEFAAINLPDAKRGEKIVLTTTLPNLAVSDMQRRVVEAGYSRLHIPSEIRQIKAFPLLGSGKTDYVTLKQWIEHTAANV